MLIKKDSFNIYFPINSSKINNDYLDNYITLKRLHDLLLFLESSKIDSIRIYSYSSPEGRIKYNNNLSIKRGKSVKDYFDLKYSHIPLVKIISLGRGENWYTFKNMVSLDKNLPNQIEVLNIINNKTKKLDYREKQLKQINKGKVYKYISKNIFPYLNTSKILIYYKKREYHSSFFEKSIEKKQENTSDSNKKDSEDNLSLEFLIKNSLNVDTLKNELKVNDSTAQLQNNKSSKSITFALKNNSLYDLILAPNIEVEFPIKHWSINLEYQFPWYVDNSKHLCYQVLLGGLEGRYWFYKKAEHKPLTGFFIGAYVGAGIFDLQNGEEGTQGNINFLTGISGGYSKSISKNFNIEFSLGLGFLNSNNINYYAYEELLIKKNDSKFSYFGLTKAKISLVWIINNKKY
ncbi:MAG: DUF3575 domain-containing protein [Bacteroidales bacterium]